MTAETQERTPEPRSCVLCGQDLQEEAEDTDVHEACHQAFVDSQARSYAQAEARQRLETDARAEMVREIWGKRV